MATHRRVRSKLLILAAAAAVMLLHSLEVLVPVILTAAAVAAGLAAAGLFLETRWVRELLKRLLARAERRSSE